MPLWVRCLQVARSSPPPPATQPYGYNGLSAQGLNPKPKTLKPSLAESWQDRVLYMAPYISMNATMVHHANSKTKPCLRFHTVHTVLVHSLSSPTFKLAHGSYTTTVGLLARRPLL